MALPPILSNLPGLKQTDSATGAGKPPAAEKADTGKGRQEPEDLVELSDAARQKLAEIAESSPKEADKAQALAKETKQILAGGDETLGYDGRFE